MSRVRVPRFWDYFPAVAFVALCVGVVRHMATPRDFNVFLFVSTGSIVAGFLLGFVINLGKQYKGRSPKRLAVESAGLS